MTTSPQFVISVKVLLLNGPLTSGGVIFLALWPLAFVLLQFILSKTLFDPAFAIGNSEVEKITATEVIKVTFVNLCIDKV